MAGKGSIFRRRRRLVVIGLCVIAGALLLWAIARQLGVNRAIADWQEERAATRKGIEDAAAIERSDAAAAARSTTPGVRPRSVTVAALLDTYRRDPRAAQRLYEGRQLEVAGEVARVTGTSDDAAVVFVSPKARATVTAVVAPQDADLISLVQPGAKISLLCGNVTAVEGVPQLSDCRF